MDDFDWSKGDPGRKWEQKEPPLFDEPDEDMPEDEGDDE